MIRSVCLVIAALLALQTATPVAERAIVAYALANWTQNPRRRLMKSTIAFSSSPRCTVAS